MSFKKRRATPSEPTLAGTQASTSLLVTSSGIASLDDVFGGGIPLSSVALVLTPDPHTAYGDLLQRYFVAQGLANRQHVAVVAGKDAARKLVDGCMWMSNSPKETDSVDENKAPDDDKVKIARRYEKMKKFQTTVQSSTTEEEYCKTFDLSSRIPSEKVEHAFVTGLLETVPVEIASNLQVHISKIQELLSSHSTSVEFLDSAVQVSFFPSRPGTIPLRIAIPSLGSSDWGDLSHTDILRFLHSLRALLRSSPTTCAFVTLAPHIAKDNWGGPGWTSRLGWLTDACISLTSFSSDPSMMANFPSHHGLVHIYSLPSLHTLVPPSDKLSVLRGLASSGPTGGGENNLAFKCTRKKLVIETLHLDVEGGVTERRTTPNAAPAIPTVNVAQSAAPTVEVQIEERMRASQPSRPLDVEIEVKKSVKARKKVAFQSDRPELYDF